MEIIDEGVNDLGMRKLKFILTPQEKIWNLEMRKKIIELVKNNKGICTLCSNEFNMHELTKTRDDYLCPNCNPYPD